MEKGLKMLGVICGVVAFAFCLAGGIWILSHVGFKRGVDAVWAGVRLYFVGKAVFVGPLLIITALRNRRSA